ncbi:MAG TPA: histidine phosphatase family protein [Chryseosolibacter sp.]|nr:histidine phosphatase family protein [Chryseosolibacter sp.]
MPKKLYLLRHANSIEKQPGQSDRDRELSPSGIKECFQIGAYLLRHPVKLDVIYSSSAERARQTTQLIVDTIKFDHDKIFFEDELYDASVITFLDFIHGIDDQMVSVLCVGHNPVISYLSEYLTRSEIGDIATGGMVAIDFEFSSWKHAGQANGKLAGYVVPASNYPAP